MAVGVHSSYALDADFLFADMGLLLFLGYIEAAIHCLVTKTSCAVTGSYTEPCLKCNEDIQWLGLPTHIA